MIEISPMGIISHLNDDWDDWNFISRRVTRRMRGEVSPALFQNLKKSALILEKNALTSFIYGYNFSFKMLFQAYLGKKPPKFFPAGPVFCMLHIRSLSKCP